MLAARNVLLLLVAGSFLAVSVLTLPQQDEVKEKKFGDKCDSNEDCHFNGSICTVDRSNKKASCQCRPEFAVTNHIDKCGQVAAINEPCFFNEQCEVLVFQTECIGDVCACRFERTPVFHKDGTVECIAKNNSNSEPYTDPAMLCVLAGMCLMFIIICVVLRLFSKARWRENRTIFNTPNPRLMNVSLLRDNKPPPGATSERRGRGVRGNNNGANTEAVRSPTAKSPMALPMEPKTSVVVDIQPVV
ncbi:uncharacterized protein LOC112682101 isoform X2 [Sipha flava]|uniref:Uncharacterized protein LOC112682101 isoform X2 n=1 Tax=Sipha flava TaxID=143950 RepID=A0A8B8FD48_9HEMI|nr:uncharacterized protein LOC112682101 isoform X2 [Sipha flava]